MGTVYDGASMEQAKKEMADSGEEFCPLFSMMAGRPFPCVGLACKWSYSPTECAVEEIATSAYRVAFELDEGDSIVDTALYNIAASI